jgi:uncharacterized protein YegL/TM2 domain-containing membrane protein YozV
MEGAPLDAVKRGLEYFKAEVGGDTIAHETVRVGVIPFQGEDAHMTTEALVPIDELVAPSLEAAGLTPLGAAFKELSRSIDREVAYGEHEKMGKPLVFVLTHAGPTDEWEFPREQLLERANRKLLNVITVACGPDIDEATLEAIAIGPSYVLDEKDGEYIREFFRRATHTTLAVAKELDRSPSAGLAVPLPEPPPKVRPQGPSARGDAPGRGTPLGVGADSGPIIRSEQYPQQRYQPPPMMVAPRSPALTTLASCFVPGLGSFMNGDVGKGIVILVGYSISIPLMFVVIGFLTAPVFWIWGLVDAYSGAKKWNASHGIVS